MSITPSNRVVLIGKIELVKSEIELIKSISTDSDKLPVITEILELLNKKLLELLNRLKDELTKL
jgi:hypothetical protein